MTSPPNYLDDRLNDVFGLFEQPSMAGVRQSRLKIQEAHGATTVIREQHDDVICIWIPGDQRFDRN